MILCTHYGLLVYDLILDLAENLKPKLKPRQSDTEESKETAEDSGTLVQSNLTVKYKLSVLPDESVLDCVILDPKRPKDSSLLVCCQSGNYVILRRLSSNTF